jgi:hypothetical protein
MLPVYIFSFLSLWERIEVRALTLSQREREL